MRSLKVLLLAVPVVLAVSCVRASAPFGSATFTPAYFEVGSTGSAVPACAAIATLTVTDSRAEPLKVGRRFHEDRPQDKYAIRATSEPAAWVKAGLTEAFKGSALPTVAGKAGVQVTIAALDLDEKSSFNSTFKARVVLDVTVTKPGTSEACWAGRVEGQAENYGEAGKDQNYIETMNHAMDRASVALFMEKGFVDATCGSCSPLPAKAN
jgi:hypothetical protein